MNLELMMAKKIPGGYTWTLPTRLGQMLQEIETRYGPRNKDFTILGIEFEESGPRIWYPGNRMNIAIQLSLGSQTSFQCALYELAHEAVHLLSPSGKKNANVLEEGLATYYAWDYVQRVLGVDYRKITKDVKYIEAALLVEELLEIMPDFFLKARATEFDLWKLDQKLINSVCPEFSQDKARLLALPFHVHD